MGKNVKREEKQQQKKKSHAQVHKVNVHFFYLIKT